MRYRRYHLIRYFAKEANIKIEDAENITKYFLKAFMKLLMDMKVGDSLQLRGFGVFKTKLYKGRDNVRNPKTGEKAFMPARRRLFFHISDVIKREYQKL